MSAKTVFRVFLGSLVVLPIVFAATIFLGDKSAKTWVFRGSFVLTVVVELIALFLCAGAWRNFVSGEPSRRIWGLLLGCLAIRCLAEFRLGSLYFGLKLDGGYYLFYVVILRYLYTSSDLLFAAGLVTAILYYKSTGLPFQITWRDYIYILLLAALPVFGLLLSPTMNEWFLPEGGNQIKIFRFVQVCVGTLVAGLCVAVRRYALQLGGGRLAQVWNVIWVAGIAHTGSFLVFAALSAWWKQGAELFEQYMLWVYGGCWVVAVMRQRELSA